MNESLNVTTKIPTPKAINLFLLENQIHIKDNPAISPDLSVDFAGICRDLVADPGFLSAFPNPSATPLNVIFHPQSGLPLLGGKAFVVESRKTGDCALLLRSGKEMPFEACREIGGVNVIPLSWENLILLKNVLLAEDPGATLFPRADGQLSQTSLGVGARFTTLHWPAVAWVMKALELPLTANQAAIPRELVYDVRAMLEDRLGEVPLPSLGGGVPEGHQGQSAQGTSHAAIIAFMKLGFHRHRIPWGFNANHHPIGGRFDALEDRLVEGSLFASSVTYDLAPELSLAAPIPDDQDLARAFAATVDPQVHAFVKNRLATLGLPIPEIETKRLETYLWSAMQKVLRRDQAFTNLRRKFFTPPVAQAFLRELALDELPAQTTPDTVAVCLAMGEALGMTFHFVAPNIGLQANVPYPDNDDLRAKVGRLHAIAKPFGVSLGFHAGSGKSAENFQVLGEVTGGNLEVKTAGRYTYEMGVALAASTDPTDKKLWGDWYQFTRALATQRAFSSDETQRSVARKVIVDTLETAKKSSPGVFDSPAALTKALSALPPSPDHRFWIEYNFLFVLAAGGATDRLGDHTPEGYAQRARFYAISDQSKLRFAKNAARHLLFQAEATGLRPADQVVTAKAKLESIASLGQLAADVA